jgi:hypothetical protein
MGSLPALVGVEPRQRSITGSRSALQVFRGVFKENAQQSAGILPVLNRAANIIPHRKGWWVRTRPPVHPSETPAPVVSDR